MEIEYVTKYEEIAANLGKAEQWTNLSIHLCYYYKMKKSIEIQGYILSYENKEESL
jgi:hypothetical protein